MKLLFGTSATLVLSFVVFAFKPLPPTAQRPEVSSSFEMPKPREIMAKENEELRDLLARRFGAKITEKTGYRAAGPFRFVGDEGFLYIDRTDVGSVAFERPSYGDPANALDRNQLTQDILLRRVQSALDGKDLDVPNRRFSEFQDEFVGAAQPAKLSKSFDPRKESKLVARTLNFSRVEKEVPFFGSEFLIGLNPDGTIGRLRKHWPQVEGSVIEKAADLQRAVRSGQWKVPEELRSDDYKIIEVTAGVGHSTFADPGFRADAVVRVIFRRTAKGTEYPISSTGYKYFDSAGKEVVFSKFPQVRETPRERKQK
jgi:hypothetical protein